MIAADVIDLFAGPGGWDVAARSLGFETLGIEWDRAAAATREAAGLRTLVADIRALDPMAYRGAHGLIASPPCTDFSVAGLRRGVDGPTGKLVEQALIWATALRPEWIAFEQVPPVLAIWKEYASALAGLGYHVWAGLLRAEQYGVPQTRRRAVLMAHRSRQVGPPAPTHSAFHPLSPGQFDLGVQPWISMAQALGWGMTKRPAGTVVGAPPGPKSGQRPLDGGSGAREVYRRAVRSGEWVSMRPSTTIVGSYRPEIVAAPGWRKAGDGPRQTTEGSVVITVQDAGVLQSFPPDYPWSGPIGKQFQQVGNAIPPLLARAILAELSAVKAEGVSS